MTSEPNYYAIIPADVRYDTELIANAKLLYGEITALCNKRGYCWATNEHFATLYNTSEKTITRWIKNLCDKGYIDMDIQTFRYDDGTVKKIRYIFIDKNVYDQRDKIGDNHTDKTDTDHTDKNVYDHMDKNVPYNNTIYNNTINNTTNNNIGNQRLPCQLEVDHRKTCREIVDEYNRICVSYPKVTAISERRKQAIKARQRQYSDEDFKRLFELAEQSSFLKGDNNRDWQATFDWLMKDANFAKALDGNYNDKNESKPAGESLQEKIMRQNLERWENGEL